MFLHLLFSVTNPFLPPCSDFELQRLVVWTCLTPAVFPNGSFEALWTHIKWKCFKCRDTFKIGPVPASFWAFFSENILLMSVP